MSHTEIISTWNNRYFDGKLSAKFTDVLAELPIDREDLVDFIERLFKLMYHGRFGAADISPRHATTLVSLLSNMLPGGWAGRIPPITLPGRHTLIDDYIRGNRWHRLDTGLLLDIGCGFPPVTTLESVAALPNWQVLAADPSLPAYVVYDSAGNYATFNAEGEIVYFQPVSPTVESWNELVKDRTATEAHFRRLRDRLLPALGQDAEVESGGARLVDPVRLYSGEHLSFQTAGIGDVDVRDVDVARCFNVLIYFDAVFRRNAMDWFADILGDGGLLLTGTDSVQTTECRYTVYQKVTDRLVAREFAFSVDNLCPHGIGPWYTLVDDDHETLRLADLVQELRSNTDFRHRLYEVSDRLRAEHDLDPRGPDGFYEQMNESIGAAELQGRRRKIRSSLDKELAQEAVDVLRTGGHEAWVNDVGHIAVRRCEGTT